jgi:hypothetical protein
MRSVRNILAVCVITLMSQVAVAIPMNYTFDVQFTDGPLAATQATVAVTLAGVGTGLEAFNPDGDLGGTLLAFDFTFGGGAFSMADDADFGEYPEIGLLDGGLDFIDFLSGEEFPFAWICLRCEDENTVVFASGEESVSEGIVLEQTWSRTDVDVPVPGTLVLFALGLAGLGLQRSKRAASR